MELILIMRRNSLEGLRSDKVWWVFYVSVPVTSPRQALLEKMLSNSIRQFKRSKDIFRLQDWLQCCRNIFLFLIKTARLANGCISVKWVSIYDKVLLLSIVWQNSNKNNKRGVNMEISIGEHFLFKKIHGWEGVWRDWQTWQQSICYQDRTAIFRSVKRSHNNAEILWSRYAWCHGVLVHAIIPYDEQMQ